MELLYLIYYMYGVGNASRGVLRIGVPRRFGFGACALEFVEDTITQDARAGKRKSGMSTASAVLLSSLLDKLDSFLNTLKNTSSPPIDITSTGYEPSVVTATQILQPPLIALPIFRSILPRVKSKLQES